VKCGCCSPAILLLPHSLPLGIGQRSISWSSAVRVLFWFADYCSVLQHCLTFDAAYWLRRWAFWTVICPILGSSLSPAHWWPFCLSSLCLLNVPTEISSLPLPPSPVHLEHSAHSAVCSFSVACLLFRFFFFLRGWGSVCPGGYVGLSQGWLWNTMCYLFAHLLVCWLSPKQVWRWHLAVWEPSFFLRVMWHGEALYGLGVQGVKALIPFSAFFLPSVALVSQQNFWFTELLLSASAFLSPSWILCPDSLLCYVFFWF
jgi:hypothetical protein